jgi:hypothetical protein
MNKKSFIFGILIVIIFVSIGFLILQQTGSPPSKSEPKGMEEWKQMLTSLNSSLAHYSVDYILSNDRFALNMYISKIKEKIHGFDYLIFVNKDGKILTHPDSSQVMQEYKPQGLKPLGEKNSLIQIVDRGGNKIYDIASPVLLENMRVGEVHLGLKNPWNKETETENGSSSNLPKILLIAAAFIGIVLSLFGALGSSSAIKSVTKGVSQERYDNLKTNKDQIEKELKTLKKKYEDLSKKKPAVEESKLSEQIENLRKKEAKLTKIIDEKNAEIVKLEKAKEAESASTPEFVEMKNELETKDKQINELKNQLEEIKAEGKTESEGEEPTTPEDIEELKKEELELTQRIVKKRREEITLSQRVETKRKEELALERKIEALQKKLKESGS